MVTSNRRTALLSGLLALSAGGVADAVWDTVRMNNIAQHFVTAYLGVLLKGDASLEPYLDLVPDSDDGVWAIGSGGIEDEGHTYWRGFPNRTASGLRWEKLEATR